MRNELKSVKIKKVMFATSTGSSPMVPQPQSSGRRLERSFGAL
jgi:hypothetical protein